MHSRLNSAIRQTLGLILLVCLPVCAFAAADLPANLEPLPDVPPPPVGVIDKDVAEPEVTIVKKGADTVEEYRMHGELYMMKVTPAHGKSYYLMREDQGSDWTRMDGPNPPLVIPKWVLFRF